MGLMLTTGIEPVLAPYKRAILPLEDASEIISTMNLENRLRKNQNFFGEIDDPQISVN
jgi:hypothetical protein